MPCMTSAPFRAVTLSLLGLSVLGLSVQGLAVPVSRFSSSVENWDEIAPSLPGRTADKCKQRWIMSVSPVVKHGVWAFEEDTKLIDLVAKLGKNCWGRVSSQMSRNAVQCRTRYLRTLDPSLSFAPWTPAEDEKLDRLYAQHGPSWTKIATLIGSRSDLQCRRRHGALRNMWTRDEGRSAKQCEKRWETAKKWEVSPQKWESALVPLQVRDRAALMGVKGQLMQIRKQMDFLEKEKERLLKRQMELQEVLRWEDEEEANAQRRGSNISLRAASAAQRDDGAGPASGQRAFGRDENTAGPSAASDGGFVEEELLDCDLDSELLQVTGSLGSRRRQPGPATAVQAPIAKPPLAVQAPIAKPPAAVQAPIAKPPAVMQAPSAEPRTAVQTPYSKPAANVQNPSGRKRPRLYWDLTNVQGQDAQASEQSSGVAGAASASRPDSSPVPAAANGNQNRPAAVFATSPWKQELVKWDHDNIDRNKNVRK